jgi:D-aspartate ligase
MINNDNSYSVLIPDGECDALASHIKDCLSAIPGIKIYLMSSNKNISTRFSKFIHNFSHYPKTNIGIEWIGYLNKELATYNIDLIMPVDSWAIKQILINIDLIKYQNRLVLLPSLEMFIIANNKALLAKHLELHSIPSPKSYFLELDYPLRERKYKFPLLLKPIEGPGGGEGIVKFEYEVDFHKYIIRLNNIENYILQEYLTGYDIDCSVLCKEGNIKAFTIQKGILYGKKKYAPPNGITFLYEKKIFIVVEKLMKSLNWSGVAHIDLRYDKMDGQYKVIEINTRFWGSTEASLVAGVNFPYLLCELSNKRSFTLPIFKNINYFNIAGIFSELMHHSSVLKQSLRFILNNTPIKFALKDPMPFLAKLMFKIKNKIFNKKAINNKQV